MVRGLSLIVVIVTLVGCTFGAESEIKKAVLERLKDPDSAKFGEITIGEENACATVNAKNAMGGYTGDKQFALSKMSGKWVALDTLDGASHSMCVRVWVDKKDT